MAIHRHRIKAERNCTIFLKLTLDRADYYIGNIYWDQEDVDEAEIYWKRAHDVMEEEDDKHPSTSAVKLKLAWVDMSRGKIEEAM